MIHTRTLLCTLFLLYASNMCGQVQTQAKFSPLPRFSELKDQLPAPIFDEDSLLVRTYWKAWELASTHFYLPSDGSGFVSPFIDAAFNANIFLWDTSFMTMFCNYGFSLVPGIASLDNFYCKQHPDGEICREIKRATGTDFEPWVNREDAPLFSRWGWRWPVTEAAMPVTYVGRPAPAVTPRLTLDALNNPMLSWAELESFQITADTARLARVWGPLTRYYQALRTYLLQGNGLYITDWASMDNSTRNDALEGGGQGVDISAQMVMFGRDIAAIADILQKTDESKRYRAEAETTAARINRLMWDRTKNFYVDLTLHGTQVPIRTIAAYWTMLARVAPPGRAARLVRELSNPATFGRKNPVPTCAADEPGFEAAGGYWRGAVWAPTNTMVIRGLERYGYDSLAQAIAMRHVRLVAEVFRSTGTIWENYSPDSTAAGRHEDGAPVVRDFVGWSGIGPIMYFLEYGIGLRADAPRNELTWTIRSRGRVGCDRFRFRDHIVSLVSLSDAAGNRTVEVISDGPFLLRVRIGGISETFRVNAGMQRFAVKHR